MQVKWEMGEPAQEAADWNVQMLIVNYCRRETKKYQFEI